MNSIFRLIIHRQKSLFKQKLFVQLTHPYTEWTRADSVNTCSTQQMSEKLKVFHNTDDCEFFIKLAEDNVAKAVLQYSWVDKSTVDMHHTGVPQEFRGHGVAKLLAKYALDFAVEKDLKFYLTCTYLQKYVKDNPSVHYTERLLSP